jgi:hypothetical protein
MEEMVGIVMLSKRSTGRYSEKENQSNFLRRREISYVKSTLTPPESPIGSSETKVR